MTRKDLDDFVKCYNVKNIQNRKESERFKKFSYKEIVSKDKCSLDIPPWIKDDSLIDVENLPKPKEIIEEIKSAINEAGKMSTSIEELLDGIS